MTAPEQTCLPKIGIIEDGIGAGFLIETNVGLGILDFFITNPESTEEIRDKSLSDIAHALTITAKNMKMKSLICDTKINSIKRLAEKQGFIYLGEYSTFKKELI